MCGLGFVVRFVEEEEGILTCSRWVMSSAASNWATMDLRTSFPMEGRTRSS